MVDKCSVVTFNLRVVYHEYKSMPTVKSVLSPVRGITIHCLKEH